MRATAPRRLLGLATLTVALAAAGSGCGEKEFTKTIALPSEPPPPPGSAAEAEAKFPPGEGPRIRGTVTLDPALADQAAGHPLLLILRSPEGGGMPIAVIRVDDPEFPLPFDLGPEHAPLQADDTPQLLRRENKLFARVSIGGAVAGSPEDLESAPVAVRADGPEVTLAIDHRRGP